LLEFRLTTAEVVDGAYVVALAGEADSAAADSLADCLGEVLDERPSCLIVDLLEVQFVDSRIMGILLRASHRLRSRGGELVVVADDPRILRTFELAGLVAHFRFERTLTAAVEDAVKGSVR
jgi:anti-sigma B factor antagonist